MSRESKKKQTIEIKKQKKVLPNRFVLAFKVFFQAIGYYFANIDKFIIYLAFPILGQLIGIVLIFMCAYFYTQNLQYLCKAFPMFNNISFVFLILLFISLPGFLIFIKAFYDYIIKITAINAMVVPLRQNDLQDLHIFTQIIERRLTSYIALLLASSILIFVSSCAFVLPGIITFVFLSLTNQIFALSDDKSFVEVIKTSFLFVTKNFFFVLIILTLLTLLTYYFLPSVTIWFFEYLKLDFYLAIPIQKYLNLLPIDEVNRQLCSLNISYTLDTLSLSESMCKQILSILAIAFTLPLRDIALSLYYWELKVNNKR